MAETFKFGPSAITLMIITPWYHHTFPIKQNTCELECKWLYHIAAKKKGFKIRFKSVPKIRFKFAPKIRIRSQQMHRFHNLFIHNCRSNNSNSCRFPLALSVSCLKCRSVSVQKVCQAAKDRSFDWMAAIMLVFTLER